MASYLGLEDDRFKGRTDRRRVFKQILYEKAQGICQLCGKPVSFDDAQLDHILPVKQGGSNHHTNFQIAHGRCNGSKGGKLPPWMKRGNDFSILRKRGKSVMEQKLSKRRAQYDKDLIALCRGDDYTDEAARALFNEYRRDYDAIESKYRAKYGLP